MFSLNSYRYLKQSLGEHDAIVQFQECARRSLLDKFDSVKKESDVDFPSFISKESLRFGIHLHDLTIKSYPNIIFQSYLIFPNSLMEEFVDNFINDFNKLFNAKTKLPDDKRNEGKKCKLEKLIELLKELKIKGMVNEVELEIYNYYRSLRNQTAHTKSKKRTISEKSVSFIKDKYPQLAAPNKPENLSFDDFILFTATIKKLAFQITQSISSKIDWGAYIKKNKDDFPKIKRFVGDRVITYVQNIISSDYGLTLDKEVIEKNIYPFE